MRLRYNHSFIAHTRSHKLSPMLRRRALSVAVAAFLLFLNFNLGSQDRRVTTGQALPFAGEILKKIESRGKLIIGLQRNYQPFHIENPHSEFPGFDIELGERLAEIMGVRAEFRFHSIQELLQESGRAQIDLALGGLSSSLQRLRLTNFSEPYLITTPAALLSKTVLPAESESTDFARREFNSLADLNELGTLRLAVMKGSSNEELLRQRSEFARHEVVALTERLELSSALLSGRVQALVADELAIRALLIKKPFLINNYLPLLKKFREEHICMALPRGDAEYINTINFIIRELKRNGELEQLKKRYFVMSSWVKPQKDE